MWLSYFAPNFAASLSWRDSRKPSGGCVRRDREQPLTRNVAEARRWSSRPTWPAEDRDSENDIFMSVRRWLAEASQPIERRTGRCR